MLECVNEGRGEVGSEQEGIFESNLSLVMFLKLVSEEEERTQTGKTTLPSLCSMPGKHSVTICL